jgi:hypothetical protein
VSEWALLEAAVCHHCEERRVRKTKTQTRIYDQQERETIQNHRGAIPSSTVPLITVQLWSTPERERELAYATNICLLRHWRTSMDVPMARLAHGQSATSNGGRDSSVNAHHPLRAHARTVLYHPNHPRKNAHIARGSQESHCILESRDGITPCLVVWTLCHSSGRRPW